MPREDPALRRLRRICLSLPETTETITWGHPNWRVAGKIFAGYEAYKDQLRLGLKATLPQQSALIADPRIEIAPYVGHRGWISFLMEGRVEWRLVQDLILNSYRLVAPPHLAEATRAAPSRERAGTASRKRGSAGAAPPAPRAGLKRASSTARPSGSRTGRVPASRRRSHP